VTSSDRIVISSMGAMVAMAVLPTVRGEGLSQPATYRRLWAIGALGLVLAAASDFVPQVAGPLAISFAAGYAVRHYRELPGIPGSSSVPAVPTPGPPGTLGPAIPIPPGLTGPQGP